MKMTFRWYGLNDSISIESISQIPAIDGVVSAVYGVPVGEVWGEDKIIALKNTANANGLNFEVVESVPVHEDIKLGAPTRDRYIANYQENIRRLAKHGVKCICYNFMPVFDWLRSEMARPLKDGSNALAYDESVVLALNPLNTTLSLPGWDESYTHEEMVDLLNAYKDIDEEKLFENLKYFLDRIIPVAEECDVLMAIHPDDPPWGIFGLPRIITDKVNLKRFLDLYPSKYNGVTFCTGSWGANVNNDLIEMIHIAKGRIHFAHLRNILHTGYRKFEESGHLTSHGSLDMYKIVKALLEDGFDGYVRPDHGRMIWGETGKPGYGLYDRALGAMYLYGLFEAVENELK